MKRHRIRFATLMPARKISCAFVELVETPHYVVRCYRLVFNSELFPFVCRGGGGAVHTACIKFVQEWGILK
jgi:hypothetical protein